jgi:hypothetical protein
VNDSLQNKVCDFPGDQQSLVHDIELPSWCHQRKQRALDVAKDQVTRDAFLPSAREALEAAMCGVFLVASFCLFERAG